MAPNRCVTRFALLFAALVAGDIATTAYGLSLGAGEANPLGPALAIAAKMVATLAVVGLLRLQVPRWRALTASPVIVALSLPVAWNVLQLASVA